MFYEKNECCICPHCGYSDTAELLDMDPHLLCVRCPKCNSLMGVDESANKPVEPTNDYCRSCGQRNTEKICKYCGYESLNVGGSL